MTTQEEPMLRMLTPAELAKALRLTERTLENWRLRNYGPPDLRPFLPPLRGRVLG
jgi:hypothetical protein